MSIEPRLRWRSLTEFLVEEWYQEVLSLSVGILGLGNQLCSYKFQPSCPKWEQFSMSVGRSLLSKSSYEQSAWVILIVSFISMLRPICRVFAQRWSASSQISLLLTPFRLLCLLRFQVCKDLCLKSVR